METNGELARIKQDILKGVQRYFARHHEWSAAAPNRVPLSIPGYGEEEVCEALDALLSGDVTMGARVRRFEVSFADYIGVKHAIMVNSGSSANLIALSILVHPSLRGRIVRGDEILVPAIPWSTTVFPILQVGALPVFVDVRLDTYNVDMDQLRAAVTPRTRAIMVVHLLGNPVDMDAVHALAQERGLIVIEDACEAHGALVRGRKVGSFGDLATFSFFFSHHISTIEGGMVLTNNDEYADLARSLRAHGWIREMQTRDRIASQYGEFDSRFLFVSAGYNLRPTEIQGAFGIHQLARLEPFIELRRENARFWNQHLKKYADSLVTQEEAEGTRHVWFGYPVFVRPDAPFTRTSLAQYLAGCAIETRPIMAGNVAQQPVMQLYEYRQAGPLPNAQLIARNAFLFGNHQGVGPQQREYVARCVDDFMSRVPKRSVR